MVEFGSAVDAVRNALAIQNEVSERDPDLPDDRRITFRVGINVGDVIVEGDDIHGDGVNVAARLEELCAPGEVFVSRSVYDPVSGKIEAEFDDLGDQMVKNLTRPIRVYRVTKGARKQSLQNSKLDAIFDRPAVAVLPFTNMSGDPEQEYFADGLTEDIITALSRSRAFPVIARKSTFTYKGSAVKIQQAAKELGARYVLEGSVRKSGDRVRITMQFIDAATDHHVLAERYDRDLNDIFEVQDEITQNITAIIVPTLQKAEVKRSAAKQTDNLDAWDLYLRGLALIYEYKADENAAGRALLERAIALDPDYGRAYSGVAYSHYHDVALGFSDDQKESIRLCLDSARRAVELDDDDGLAHITLTFAFMRGGQFDLAMSESRKAIELDPTGLAFVVHATVLNYIGRPGEAVLFSRKGWSSCERIRGRPS